MKTDRRGFLAALALLPGLKWLQPTTKLGITYPEWLASTGPEYLALAVAPPEVFHGSFRLGEKTRWAAMSDEARARVKDCERELETYYEGSSSERSPRRTED